MPALKWLDATRRKEASASGQQEFALCAAASLNADEDMICQHGDGQGLQRQEEPALLGHVLDLLLLMPRPLAFLGLDERGLIHRGGCWPRCD